MNFIQWHKSFIERAQKEMGISNYALYWLGFVEGAIVTWLLLKAVSVLNSRSEIIF
tara:strand:- start:1151 stop:1318 length:168 start_codon:yes stop_codon:yes gene_type:complete